MPAFYILAAIGAVALLFALAPYYRSVGKFFTDMVNGAKSAMDDEDDEDDDEIE